MAMTNQTPVEYCRHENCGKPIVVCNAHGGCLAKGYRHTATDFHTCFENGTGQVAEPAGPPQQPKCEDCLWHGCIDTQCGCKCHKVKAGTQMEERKPDAKTAEQKLAHVSSTLQTLVKDIDPAPIDNFKLFREELRKELGLPDNRVWTGVGLLLAVRQLREKHNNQPISESANREPQASPSDVEGRLREEFWNRHGCPMMGQYGDDGEMQCGICMTDFKRMPINDLIKHTHELRVKAAEKQLETCELDLVLTLSANALKIDEYKNQLAKSERELQELRAQLSDTCKMVALQTNDAASLRGLVGRMKEQLTKEVISFNENETVTCLLCASVGFERPNDGNITIVHLPACLISEAEAAIKEPHK